MTMRTLAADPPTELTDGPVPHALHLIGGTPMVGLERLFPPPGPRVFGKVEKLSPGGSIKDRTALSMVTDALESGRIVPGRTTVVESSSGNLGIAMAQICAFHGLSFRCVTDPKITPTNLALMRAYGADVEVIDRPDEATGEYLPARIRRVNELIASLPDSWWPNQYANPANARAHHRTVEEILAAVPGLTHLFLATGSCGTLRGCVEGLRRAGRRDVTVIAVDSCASRIFGEPPRRAARVIPGHGAALRPPLMGNDLADWLVRVDDADCVVGCHEMLRRESLLVGGSSGAVLTAAVRFAPRLPESARCALILPDGGERYLDTIYDPSWVRRHIGPLPEPSRWAGPSGHHPPIHLAEHEETAA
ncbi:MAG: 2,3-diaminopropionate biosynthesis protein SbnA [Propionibacterium acidifaciens]